MAKQKNSKPQPQAKAETPGFTIIEPEGGTKYIYANLVQITWTVVDLKIRFAELTKIDANGRSTITEHAVATMAWSEVKTLLNFLQNAVTAYEQLNGEIKDASDLKLPPGVDSIPTAG